MSFRKIEQIKIGNNPNGEAFGGLIYELNVTIGFAGAPTSVTVNIVNENGLYNINQRDLSAIDPVAISIMNPCDSADPQVTLPSMYLVEYNYRQTTGARTLSLEYYDRSIFLGKVWLGLAGKSALPHNLTNPEDGQRMVFYKDRRQGNKLSVKLPIRCNPCSKYKPPIYDARGRTIRPAGTVPSDMEDIQYQNLEYAASAGWASNLDPERGGAIILGVDEFTNNSCEIPDVKYSWDELVYVMEHNNIFIFKDDLGNPTINNRGKIHYRAQHANQTLNSIIGAWCSDFGFEWGWDPFTNQIYGRDLTKGIVDLTPIRQMVQSFDEKDVIIISNYEQTYSIKNTHKKDHISWQQKPRKVKDKGYTSYRRLLWRNLALVEGSQAYIKQEDGAPYANGLFSQQEVKDGIFGMDRTEEEFLISCALAKYNKSARKIYLYGLAYKKYGNDLSTAGNPGVGNQVGKSPDLSPLGIKAGYRFTQREKEMFIDAALGQGMSHTEGNESPAQSFKNRYGPESDLYIASYSKDLDSAWEKWEAEVADFIGKHYIDEACGEGNPNIFQRANNPCEFNSCQGDSERDLKISTHPPSQKHKGQAYHGYNIFPNDLNIRKNMPCPPGQDCSGGGVTAGIANLRWGCWGAYASQEAYKYDEARWNPQMAVTFLNPNNDCCAYIEGINNYQILVRGYQYKFMFTDKSWRALPPVSKAQKTKNGARWPYHPDRKCVGPAPPSEAGEFDSAMGGWQNLNNCTELDGPIFEIMDRDGNVVDGYKWGGTVGVDGEIEYKVPKVFDAKMLETVTLPNGMKIQAQKVYLKRDNNSAWSQNAGCAPTPGKENEPLAFNNEFYDRVFLVVEDPAEDTGKEWFTFQRDVKWGLSQQEFDKQILNSVNQNWLQKFEPEITEVSNHARRILGPMIEEFFGATLGDMNNVFFGSTKNNENPHLIFVTNPEITDKYFSVGKVGLVGTDNPNEIVYSDKEEEEVKEKCAIECDFDVIDRFCRCYKGINFETPFTTEGLTSRQCMSFEIAVSEDEPVIDARGKPVRENVMGRNGQVVGSKPLMKRFHRSVRIKFPSTNIYLGQKQYSMQWRQTVPAVQQSIGSITNAGDALKYDVNWTDITSDLDRWYPDPMDNAAPPVYAENEVTKGYGQDWIQHPDKLKGMEGVAGQGRIEQGMIVPPPFVQVGNPQAMFTTPHKYHQELLNKGMMVNNALPSDSISFGMVGFDMNSIVPFLSPSAGLQGFRIGYGPQGMTVNFTFGTKYPDAEAIKKVSWDTLYPSINLNAFGRAF